MNGNVVLYFRVSTQRQGQSGLGLEAQRSAVSSFLTGCKAHVVYEAVEVESGKNNARPQLAEALAQCRLHNATLLIAKLDRLSRDAHFLLGLQKAGVKFVAVDMPHADTVTVGILAIIAQKEREMISARTKAALQAAKARGVKLGGYADNLSEVSHLGRQVSAQVRGAKAAARAKDLEPIIKSLSGRSLREIAAELNQRGLTTPRGAEWTSGAVHRLMARIVT